MRILYIDIDTLRADHLGCYGYHRSTSPNIDAVARQARVEPGLVLDRLRDAAEVHQLTFGPDPATHRWCTLGGMIGRAKGMEGLEPGTVELEFEGSAGQSFGAFAARGMTLTLVGEANDYVGKGLSGGTIAIRPPARANYEWKDQVIAGNTVLYGATGGALFLAGRAGERFAVRNSGAVGVAEGVGDHACEYMTAGRVVVLGQTGRNFAAGMSAGLAYVLDETGDFPERVNPEMVSVQRLETPEQEQELLELVKRHLEATDSPRAAEIVANWEAFAPKFWMVVPHPPITIEDRGTVLVKHGKAT